MLPDTVATFIENSKQLYAMIKKLSSFKVQKMGQILCMKRVPFANPVKI